MNSRNSPFVILAGDGGSEPNPMDAAWCTEVVFAEFADVGISAGNVQFGANRSVQARREVLYRARQEARITVPAFDPSGQFLQRQGGRYQKALKLRTAERFEKADFGPSLHAFSQDFNVEFGAEIDNRAGDGLKFGIPLDARNEAPVDLDS